MQPSSPHSTSQGAHSLLRLSANVPTGQTALQSLVFQWLYGTGGGQRATQVPRCELGRSLGQTATQTLPSE